MKKMISLLEIAKGPLALERAFSFFCKFPVAVILNHKFRQIFC